MSHIVQVHSVKVTDAGALETACGFLDLKLKAKGRHKMYSGTLEGAAVELPGWRHPAVIDTKTGEVKYDNFGGSWGSQIELDKLIQRYSIEAAKNEALLHGMSVTEEQLADGDVKLCLTEFAPS